MLQAPSRTAPGPAGHSDATASPTPEPRMTKPFDRRTRRTRSVATALAFAMTMLIAAGVDALARLSPDGTLAQASTDRRA